MEKVLSYERIVNAVSKIPSGSETTKKLESPNTRRGWRDEPRSLIRKTVRARDGNELGTIEAIDQNNIVLRPGTTDQTVSLPFDFLDHIQGRMVFLKVTSQELPETFRNVSTTPRLVEERSGGQQVESTEIESTKESKRGKPRGRRPSGGKEELKTRRELP
jgi:hypothetical protein